jgi:hypothetical protein
VKLTELQTDADWYRLIMGAKISYGNQFYLAVNYEGYRFISEQVNPPNVLDYSQRKFEMIVLGCEVRLTGDVADDEIEARPR